MKPTKHKIPLLACMAAITGKDNLEYEAANTTPDLTKDPNSPESKAKIEAAKAKRLRKQKKRVGK